MSYPKVSTTGSHLPPPSAAATSSIQYVIQGAKGMYIQQQQHNYDASMKIKEEPESPTVRAHLPVTPKSNEAQSNDIDGGEEEGVGESGETCEHEEGNNNYAEANEAKKFVLAPTPAQLGKAPLQRRQNQSKTQSKLILSIDFFKRFLYSSYNK